MKFLIGQNGKNQCIIGIEHPEKPNEFFAGINPIVCKDEVQAKEFKKFLELVYIKGQVSKEKEIQKALGILTF